MKAPVTKTCGLQSAGGRCWAVGERQHRRGTGMILEAELLELAATCEIIASFAVDCASAAATAAADDYVGPGALVAVEAAAFRVPELTLKIPAPVSFG